MRTKLLIQNRGAHLVSLIIILFAQVLPAVELLPVQFSEPDAIQWRGTKRNGIYYETGLLKVWKDGAPPLLWKITNIGNGYSAPIIYKDKIWITGDVGNDLIIYALDINGKLLWQATNGAAWKGPYPEARASCAYSQGRIYHKNAHGRIVCLDADSGKELWSLNALEQFGGKNITWGLSECLLVDDKNVYAIAGGSKALMVALNKTNGAVVWRSEPLIIGKSAPPEHIRLDNPAGEFDPSSYSSPILFSAGDKLLIAGFSQKHFFIVDAKNGDLLCTRPFQTRYEVIAVTPLIVEDGIFVTAPDAGGGRLFKLNIGTKSVLLNEAWKTELDTCHGCLVYLNKKIYGSFYRSKRGFASIDAQTGNVISHIDSIAMGSIIYADDRFYYLSQEGEMALVRDTPAGLKIVSKFRLIAEKKTDVWTHPVIYNKKLFLRYHNTLFCYNIAE